MTPLRELDQLLQQMQPRLHEGTWCYVRLDHPSQLGIAEPFALFREREGWSAIVSEREAVAGEFEILLRAAWIELQVHSALDAVGLTAAFATALAAARISCNVVAAAQHDHLFVPQVDAAAAMDCLQALQASARAPAAVAARTLAAVALLVRDYDEAIAWFVDALGFRLVEDSDRGAGKRWVRVAPDDPNAACLLLARAVGDEQLAAVGKQHGGRVGWFLHSRQFHADYQRMREHGVRFAEQPRHEAYGWVVVFEDLYGNRWDLLEQR